MSKKVLLLPAKWQYDERCGCEDCLRRKKYNSDLRDMTARLTARNRRSEIVTAADLTRMIY